MRLIAFAGPSVPAADRAAFPSVEWRPPAEAGDLLRLRCRPPLTICLIDGFFDHRPAVRHKEILLLLAEGASIFGASSIGALRAAEMARFGMRGVGAIYRAFAEGRIDGDDEVALAHGPREWDWRPLSLPLVDARATLCSAVRAGVLNAEEARTVRDAAAAIHYAERTWENVLAAAPAHAAARLRGALARVEVPLKRNDALACLRAGAARQPSPGIRPQAVRTVFLEALANECGVDLAGRPPTRSRAGPASSRGGRRTRKDCG